MNATQVLQNLEVEVMIQHRRNGSRVVTGIVRDFTKGGLIDLIPTEDGKPVISMVEAKSGDTNTYAFYGSNEGIFLITAIRSGHVVYSNESVIRNYNGAPPGNIKKSELKEKENWDLKIPK